MLSVDIERCRFLDLFSGSGGIGIEALSRGAARAIFVENNRKAAAIIRGNLKHTKLEENAFVYEKDAITAIKMMEGNEEPFDYIFMDPPYNQEWERKVLMELSGSSLVDEYTTIIVEASLNTSFDYLEELGFALKKEKKYKTNKHMFIILK